MIVASVHVSGVNARTTECSRITAGLVGAKIEIDYQDSVWGPLTKTVVFWGAAVKDVVTNDNVVTIPAEVVATYGKRLRVGVYGVDGSGALVIPTIWADLGEICAAADPSGDETTDPSSPVWAQVAALAEASARAAAGSANDAAASAAQAEAAAGSVGGAVEEAGVILRDTQAAARQAGTYVEEAAAAARDAAAQAESADYSAQDAAQAAQVARNAAAAAGAAADSVHADASAAAQSAELAAEAASDAVRSAEAAASGAAGAQNAAYAAHGHAASAASSAQAARTAAESVPQSIEEALAEAKASGEFDGPAGPQGDKGDPYVLTDADKDYLVKQVKAPVEEFARQAGIAYSNALVAETGAKNAEANAKTYADNASASEGRAQDQANLSYQNARAAGEHRDTAKTYSNQAAASAAEAKEAADSAAIVPKPTAAVAGKALIVNTAGTGYEFGNAPGGGGSGGSSVPSDWNAAEGQPGHILNRTHWVEENGILEVLPECQFEAEYESVSIAGEVPIAIGAEYTVHWNGVDYACIAKSVDIEGVVVPGLGNLAAFGIGEETTYPFVIIALPIALTGGVGAQVNILDGSTELTISITTVGDVIHKLDEKFLPMDTLRDVVVFEFDDYPEHMTNIPQYAQIEAALESGKDVILSFRGDWYRSYGVGPADLYFARAYAGFIDSLGISRRTGLVTYSPKTIPDDYYINRLIDAKLGVIENGTY